MKNTELDSLKNYFISINKVPLLTPEEEKELFSLYEKTKDPDIKNKIVEANLKFVVNVAKKYNGLSLEERISWGNEGLIDAVDRFEVDKGYHFISYAVWWIRQKITKAIKNSATIRIPENKINILNQISKYQDEFRKTHERDPSIEEISDYFKIKPEIINKMINALEVSSLNKEVYKNSDGYTELSDIIEDKNAEFKQRSDPIFEARDILVHFLPTLNETEREVFKRRILLNEYEKNGNSLSAIGNDLGISKERTRQIEKKVSKKFEKFQIGFDHAKIGKPDINIYQDFIDSSEILRSIFGSEKDDFEREIYPEACLKSVEDFMLYDFPKRPSIHTVEFMHRYVSNLPSEKRKRLVSYANRNETDKPLEEIASDFGLTKRSLGVAASNIRQEFRELYNKLEADELPEITYSKEKIIEDFFQGLEKSDDQDVEKIVDQYMSELSPRCREIFETYACRNGHDLNQLASSLGLKRRSLVMSSARIRMNFRKYYLEKTSSN